MGASDAMVILSSDILIEEKLAKLCEEPRCINYGLSSSCPLNVIGPAGFRELKTKLNNALVVRIIVPSEVLFSSENRELGKYLYEIVSIAIKNDRQTPL
jgi:predicted metal-binding protein